MIPIQDSNGPPDKLKKQLQIISIIAIIGLILSASALTIALLNMNDNSDDDSDDDQGTNQVADIDKDGIPDAQDIYNLGNGKLKVSIDLFEPDYTDSSGGGGIYPDPYFNITIDYNGDGIFDDQSVSHTFLILHFSCILHSLPYLIFPKMQQASRSISAPSMIILRMHLMYTTSPTIHLQPV